MEQSEEMYNEFSQSNECRIFSGLSEDRREVLQKIAYFESMKMFDVDVENDPPTKPLDYRKVDYLGKKFASKIKTAIANRVGYSFFTKLIKKGLLLTEAVYGAENLSALENGAIITCNHFAPHDNFLVYKALAHALPKGKLYKIVREGNYSSYFGLYGFLFRNCNTLPLSSDIRGSMALVKAVNELLSRGESILIYPEQAMWWNYRKPRLFKSGAFIMAHKANVPIVPVYITMRHSDKIGPDGYPIQLHSVHIMTPVYPNSALSPKVGAERLRSATFEFYKSKYEEVYGREYDL